MRAMLTVGSASLILLLIVCSSSLSSAEEIHAKVRLIHWNDGVKQDVGNLTLVQKDGKLTIEGTVIGLEPDSVHGFHVHEHGNIRNNCMSAGSHYNPHNKQHGAPASEDRHVGDLGNVRADAKGVVNVNVKDVIARLDGKYSVLKRAIVVHDGRDDLGHGIDKASKITGNAGSRYACGIIEDASVAGSTTSSASLVVLLLTATTLIW